MTQETQDKVVKAVKELEEAIRHFVTESPTFPEGRELARNIGRCQANLETILHWDCGVWELGLPDNLNDLKPTQP